VLNSASCRCGFGARRAAVRA